MCMHLMWACNRCSAHLTGRGDLKPTVVADYSFKSSYIERNNIIRRLYSTYSSFVTSYGSSAVANIHTFDKTFSRERDLERNSRGVEPYRNYVLYIHVSWCVTTFVQLGPCCSFGRPRDRGACTARGRHIAHNRFQESPRHITPKPFLDGVLCRPRTKLPLYSSHWYPSYQPLERLLDPFCFLRGKTNCPTIHQWLDPRSPEVGSLCFVFSPYFIRQKTYTRWVDLVFCKTIEREDRWNVFATK